MGWVKVAGTPGMGLEAQELLRWKNAPVASIKKRRDHWEVSLMDVSGTFATTQTLESSVSLNDVKSHCERALENMGWTR